MGFSPLTGGRDCDLWSGGGTRRVISRPGREAGAGGRGGVKGEVWAEGGEKRGKEEKVTILARATLASNCNCGGRFDSTCLENPSQCFAVARCL